MTYSDGVRFMIKQKQYWQRRKEMMYYKYIDILVKAFAYHAKSIIDIGSSATNHIENYFWIEEKFTLDIEKPYASKHVTAIEEDFLTFEPNRTYDFVTCLQVLEHIEEVERFAQKLFTLSDRILISVPYQWPQGSEPTHLHDPVCEEKLFKWTGRQPHDSIIVEEPLRIPKKRISKRLIAYYGPPNEEINYQQAQRNVQKLNNMDPYQADKQDAVNENEQIYKQLLDPLNKILTKQENHFETIREELETTRLEREVKDQMKVNEQMEHKIESLTKEIERYRRGITNNVNRQQYYLKEYRKVLQSNSWKMMKPLRKIRSILK